MKSFLLLICAGLLVACSDGGSDTFFGECELTDKDTDEVTVREDVTEQVCRNLAYEAEGNVSYSWIRNDQD